MLQDFKIASSNYFYILLFNWDLRLRDRLSGFRLSVYDRIFKKCIHQNSCNCCSQSTQAPDLSYLVKSDGGHTARLGFFQISVGNYVIVIEEEHNWDTTKDGHTFFSYQIITIMYSPAKILINMAGLLYVPTAAASFFSSWIQEFAHWMCVCLHRWSRSFKKLEECLLFRVSRLGPCR